MADSLIYDLCKAAGKELLKKACLLHDVPEEANKIEQNLENIKAVLPDAEQREMVPSVKRWLSELRNVAYDIEDVLEDYSIADSRYVWTKQLKSDYDIAQRIKSINEKLGEIDERKNRFNFLTSINRINERPKLKPTSAYGDYPVVRSQEEVKAKVIEKLVPGDSKGNVANGNHIPIISLVGMGGIGKTTLARLVYDDKEVKGHFRKTIWVYVGKNFNETKVARDIAEGFGVKVSNDSTLHSVLSDIDLSITKFDASNTSNTKTNASNTSKMFLLVLDDVWEDSEGKWSDILGCLGKGDTQGSRILMTTRNSEFSKKMGVDIVPVEELPAEDAWSLFSHYAFSRDSDHRKGVKVIAEKLAEKCDGLPLALEVLGRHMATKTMRKEWDDVLRSEMWKTEFEDRVFNSLTVSYVELPSAAKRCFAFCSIFPKGTVMTKFNLIRLWMAQGYLEGYKPDQMEVLGEECFKSLEMRSFIRVSRSYDLDLDLDLDLEKKLEFADMEVTMHDLVHDFARCISDGEVAILHPSLGIHEGGVISKKLRHLAISGETSESNCLHSTALRTFFLSADPTAILKAVCSKISYIRALDVRIYSELRTSVNYHFKDIGKLVHLRYLRLEVDELIVLPKEICGLPFLQTLDVSDCYQLETLPNEIGRLTKLRHLLFPILYSSLPKGLGKLSSLQTLSYFSCSALDDDGGSSIEDLRGLNNIRGELQLKELDNVANVNEATRAELHMKTQIRKLHLEFGYGDASLQSDVLEALQPASLQSEVLEALQPAEVSLEFLVIRGHGGRRCPGWIGKMQYLREVLLEDDSMGSLPEMGMLCFLEKLTIRRAHEVKYVGAEFYGMVEPDEGFFPRLTDLEFSEMSRWEHWEGPNVITRSGVRVTIMPSLRCLIIDDCELLQTLPRFLEHVPLESLELSGTSLPLVEAAEIDYPNRWQIGDILLPQTMKHIKTPYLTLRREESEVILFDMPAVPRYIIELSYLRKIELMKIEDESLPPFGLLPSLLVLSVWEAHNVGKVGDEFLGISSNNTTAASVVVFPRLEELTFGDMPAWREWEDPVHGGNINLAIMPFLLYLRICGCNKLKSLPHFFDSVPLLELDVEANEEGDMVRIRNSSRMDEATACKTIIASAATLSQPALGEIRLSGVKNVWVLGWAKYCKGLEELTLSYGCGVASLASLELLPSLEFLEISSRDIRHIGKELLQLSSLLHLKLRYMDNLEEWEDPPPQLEISDESRGLSRRGNNNGSAKIIMPSLLCLSIYECPKLKALPSFLRSVPLEELEIHACPRLKTWWINEDREDWRDWSRGISRFSLQDNYRF